MVREKSVLDSEQVASFSEQGYLLLEKALTDVQLIALQACFEDWVNESRQFSGSYGQTLDGRARFDVEPGHTPNHPALRRVSSPIEVSNAYLEVMRDSRALDAVTQLLGPNVKLNNTKVNSKLPGTATAVQYHQDFLFEPHSNQDLVAVLFFLDEVTERNGPLELVPGSPRSALRSLARGTLHWCHRTRYRCITSSALHSMHRLRGFGLSDAYPLGARITSQ
jgi:ectoine hydroxylase-related dioxygenase (phytanoyl-CoA dioxygenase family)